MVVTRPGTMCFFNDGKFRTDSAPKWYADAYVSREVEEDWSIGFSKLGYDCIGKWGSEWGDELVIRGDRTNERFFCEVSFQNGDSGSQTIVLEGVPALMEFVERFCKPADLVEHLYKITTTLEKLEEMALAYLRHELNAGFDESGYHRGDRRERDVARAVRAPKRPT